MSQDIVHCASGTGFKAQLNLFCTCGWMLTDNDSGWYCENPQCALKTLLFAVSVIVTQIPLPTGLMA